MTPALKTLASAAMALAFVPWPRESLSRPFFVAMRKMRPANAR
jgi:hypothetical protein